MAASCLQALLPAPVPIPVHDPLEAVQWVSTGFNSNSHFILNTHMLNTLLRPTFTTTGVLTVDAVNLGILKRNIKFISPQRKPGAALSM